LYKIYNKNVQKTQLEELKNMAQKQSDETYKIISQMLGTVKTRMQKIESLKNDSSRYSGMNESDIVITKNGEWLPAGLAIYNIQKQIDSEKIAIDSDIEKIKIVAIQNNVHNEDWFKNILNQFIGGSHLHRYTDNGEMNNQGYSEPNSIDIARLTTIANSLREKIQTLPQQSVGGDAQYNAIVNNAIGNAIGPLSNQFNAECRRFEGIYGRDNLIRIARQNGFYDLLP